MDRVFDNSSGGEKSGLSIALVTETFPPEINGVAMTMGRLVQGLAERGHRVCVVRPRQPAACHQETAHPRIDHTLRPSLPIPGYSGLRLGFPSRRLLTAQWLQERPDVVHVVTEGPLGYTAMQAALALGIPVSSSFHTNFHDYSRHYSLGMLHGVIAGYLRRFHNRTACTMVPSADLIEVLAGQGYRNLRLLDRGVDVSLFTPLKRDRALRASWGADDNDVVALHVGRVAPEKNIPLALRAFTAIASEQPTVRMVVVGDGPLRNSLTKKHPGVTFTGALSVTDLARHYASCDLFLLPSMSETFGNVLLEAMASGLACVGFDYAAARAHLRHGKNGLSAPFGDQEAFIGNALIAARAPELSRRLGQAARITTEDIGWARVVLRFETLLRQVVQAECGTECRADQKTNQEDLAAVELIAGATRSVP